MKDWLANLCSGSDLNPRNDATGKQNKKPTNWFGWAHCCTTKKFDPKSSFSVALSNFDNCRPEAAGDVISSVAAV